VACSRLCVPHAKNKNALERKEGEELEAQKMVRGRTVWGGTAKIKEGGYGKLGCWEGCQEHQRPIHEVMEMKKNRRRKGSKQNAFRLKGGGKTREEPQVNPEKECKFMYQGCILSKQHKKRSRKLKRACLRNLRGEAAQT